MDELRNRFIKVIEMYCSGNQSKFAKTIGVSQGNISNIFSRGTIPSSELIAKTSIAFPKLNLRWLLTGDGEEMEISSSSKEESSPITNERLLSIIESQQRTIENLSNSLHHQ